MQLSVKRKGISFELEVNDGTIVELLASKFTIKDQIDIQKATKVLNVESDERSIEAMMTYNANIVYIGIRNSDGSRYFDSVDEVIESDLPVDLINALVKLISDANGIGVLEESKDLDDAKKNS